MTRAVALSMRAAGRSAVLACALAVCAPAFGQAPAATTPSFPKSNVSTDVTDIWWPDNEPGWGIQLIQNADIIFATMFVYDPGGEPIFFVATLGKLAGADTWTGDLAIASGTYYAAPWNPDERAELAVGTMSFTLNNVYSGTLDYTVGPTSVQKTVSRQVLKHEDNSGDYRITHTWTSAGAGCTDTDTYNPASGPVNGDMAIQRLGPDTSLLSLTWRLAPVEVCSMTALYSQVGRLGAYSGVLSCPSSATSGTLVLYEVANRPRMLTGRYEMDWSYGCTRTGQFTAIMPVP